MAISLDMLRDIRLTGAVFLDAEFTAPWCIAARVEPEDCAPFTPVPRHLIAYHYVTEGRLFLSVPDQPPVVVKRGEIVLLPRNDEHLLASALTGKPVNPEQLLQRGPDHGLARICHGGGGERTRILCGFLGNNTPHSAAIALLPRVMKINVADGRAGGWIESSFRFAAEDLDYNAISSPLILARLAELLFFEAVRRYLLTLPPDAGNPDGAVRDPYVCQALSLLHSQLGRRWTTETLAREVGLSRSAFAEHFTRALGEPPMHYLAQQRLEQASARLVNSNDSIIRIATDIGYETEAAFSRAFKREFGVPPATWRRDSAQRSL
ncbi:AraC family transcriptional regulator [Marinobacter sp. X15-166B]|uniref:AraC family transcriptional regulator n=1 Tax=Marinobacter sp. X15-166B TaxID=1897620 RepID=UPI00085C2A71|nr:AraC family transcriptional regulator [Marinobacter sp. X15-166B]OEY67568.1 AraC family transcriptional regulator [Marinobacter sp. X15-166B]